MTNLQNQTKIERLIQFNEIRSWKNKKPHKIEINEQKKKTTGYFNLFLFC